jgi:hypothetical protein
VGIRIRSLIYSYQKKENKAKVMKFFSSQFRIKLIIMEDIPQFTLQLYIAGRKNRVDPLLLFSLLTSFFSASKGMVNLLVDGVVDRMDTELYWGKELLYNVIFVPFFGLIIVCLIPISLYSSLINHSHPGFLALVVYFIFHGATIVFLLHGPSIGKSKRQLT